LTPYALTRRKGSRKDREKERQQKEDSPGYRMQSNGGKNKARKVKSPIKPDAADISLKKAERRMHSDPKTACKSQSPNPANVRAALHG
tara:strand:+ start:1790 stop:2053 length:264 start_codon:yes stop_codon:yes gene_type:complete